MWALRQILNHLDVTSAHDKAAREEIARTLAATVAQSHQEIMGELAPIKMEVTETNGRVTHLEDTLSSQSAELKSHGEDIAYLKGVHAGKAEIAQATSAALNAISLPHEGNP